MALRATDLLIDDSNFRDFVDEVVVDGEHKAKGLVPRNYDTHPQGFYKSVPAWDVDMPVIPRSEWAIRIKELEESHSNLSSIRMRGNNGKMIDALDQGQQGFCWMYSGTAAVILVRAVMHQPYVRLSAHAPACIIKKFQDQGGWGAHGLEFLTERGVPSVDKWPEKSMSRQYDNAETWADAANYKVTAGWVDLVPPVYHRKLSFDQVATCLLLRTPVISDFNWWGHSVCAMDLVDLDPSLSANSFERWGVRILNSWTNNWGDKGTAVLKGQKAIPNGASAPRMVLAS